MSATNIQLIRNPLHLRVGLFAVLLAFCTQAHAETPSTVEPSTVEPSSADNRLETYHSADNTTPQTNWFTLSSDIAATAEGFDKHRLSDGRKLLGWKLSETLYFGRAKKEGATVSLVWEKSADQRLSLSTDGLKFTRRLK